MPITKQTFPIGRIVLKGRSLFNPEKGGQYLSNTLQNYWPKHAEVDILITPGAFIFQWLRREWGRKNYNKWESDQDDLQEFVEMSIENVHKMLDSSNLLKAAKGRAKFITIGSEVCFSDDYTAELIFLVDVQKRDVKYLTGKSYPTRGQESKLIQETNLKSHFKRILNHRVMILGCHDLNMFSARTKKNAGTNKKGDRYIRIKKMLEEARDFKPTLVIQHPHTVDSPRIWSVPWSGLLNELKTVHTWASAIRFYNGIEPTRACVYKVLHHTKADHNRVLDVFLEKR